MKNLTTRKIVLGLLMTLVLAFGVQGIVEAVTISPSTSPGDLTTLNAGDTISLRSIRGSLNNSSAVESVDITITGTATANFPDPEDSTTSLTTDTYTEQTTTSVPDLTAGTGNGTITIPSSLTITTSGEGTVIVTVTWTPRVSTDTSTKVFTFYVVPDSAITATAPVVVDATQGYRVGVNEVAIDNTVFTIAGNLPLRYSVSGGSLSVKIGSRTRSVGSNITSSTAPVFLKMNGRTSVVGMYVEGHGAARAARTTIIYRYPRISKVSGDSPQQVGASGSRLLHPFTIQVRDGSGASGNVVPGQEVTFVSNVADSTFSAHPDFPDIATNTNLLAGSPQTEINTTTATVTTNSQGSASVFLVLGSITSGTEEAHTVTARIGPATTPAALQVEFKAEANSLAEARSITKVAETDGQRADALGNVEKPLTVVIRDQGGSPKQGEDVTFSDRSGGTVGPPISANGDPGIHNTASGITNTIRTRVVTTDANGEASVNYTAREGGAVHTVSASITRGGYKEVLFTINGTAPSTGTGTGTGTGTDTTTTTNSITISPSSITGGTGDTETISVSSSPSGVLVSLSSNDFANTSFSPQSGLTPFSSTLTLPSSTGSYSFFAVGSIAGATVSDSATVTVESAGLGTLTISPSGAPVNGIQNVSITARDADGDVPADAVSVTLSGTGFATTTATVQGGSVIAPVRLPTTAATYVLTARATGYEDATTRLVVGGQQPVTGGQPTPTGSVGAAASLEIDGQRLRSGIVNEPLDAPLRVRVTDANGRGVSGVRVTFRVLSPARGTFAGARGRGNAVLGETDRNGYTSANFTPTSSGDVVVRASASGVSPVTFILDINGGPEGETDTRTPSPDVPPSREISPVVHVGAANRPPMLWVDGGKIYALVGTDVQEFASGVEGAMNVAIGGRKVYWTEQTGQSSGTINSANLDGTGVTELTSIMAVPMGIAVDGAGSKLYWTNSRGRIQRANLDGSKIQNVLQNLPSPMDIALLGGNAYWTQGGNVRVVNLSGTKRIRNISTGADAVMSLVISGGKVYWTEQTGQSAGTINRANLDGSAVTQLTSIKAVPMGIAVDGSRRKIFWTNSRGRVQSANLDGSKIQNVVDGLGMPGDMLLSNSLSQTTAGTSTPTQPTQTADNSKYDVNGDGKVDNADVSLVAGALNTTNARYDVNGDNVVNASDIILISNNLDPGAAAAPMLLGMKLTATQIDNIKEQIDLLIATGDRSPAVMRTLIYLQQLIATARPEKTQLLANYPNPFNPETWIPYELATDTNVRITIYNTQGVVIRTLALGHQSAGYYTGRDWAAYWDGRNALGEQVASGIYFYQFETDDISSMRKMVILK